MKRIYLMFFLLSIIQLSNGQNSILKIDHDYFLVGTLSDYMGREKYKKIEKRVDVYYQSEKKMCLLIDSIFRPTYPDLVFSAEKNETTLKDEFELYSESLARNIEKFYNYEPSGRKEYSGEADFETLNIDSLTKTKDFSTIYFDTIYTGKLKLDIFKTELQKISFIVGAYIRFGDYINSKYQISIPNSASKVSVLVKLLKDIGCSDVKYEIKNKYIPVGHTVFFYPTDGLKTYFDKYQIYI